MAGSLSSHSPCVMRQAWGEGGGRCFLSACQAPPRHSRHQPPARQLQRSTSNKQPSPPRPATPRHPSPHLALHVIVKVGGLKEGPRQQVACRKQVGEELEGGGQLAQALARRILLQLRRCLAAVLVAAGRGTGGQEWATDAARVQSERRHVYRRTVQAVAHQNKPPHQASAQPHLTATAMSRRVSTICAPVKSRWPSCNSAGWGGGSSQKVWQPALSREWGSSQQHQRPPVCGLPSGFHELLVPAPCAPCLPGSAAGL